MDSAQNFHLRFGQKEKKTKTKKDTFRKIIFTPSQQFKQTQSQISRYTGQRFSSGGCEKQTWKQKSNRVKAKSARTVEAEKCRNTHGKTCLENHTKWRSYSSPPSKTLAKVHQAVTGKKFGVLISFCCWERNRKWSWRGKGQEDRWSHATRPRSHLTHEQTAVLWKKCVERLKVSGHRRSCGWLWYKQEHWLQEWRAEWGMGVTFVCTRQLSSGTISEFSSLYILA